MAAHSSSTTTTNSGALLVAAASSQALVASQRQQSGKRLDLGLDFTKMDFKEIAQQTNSAIQKDKRVGQAVTSTPNASGQDNIGGNKRGGGDVGTNPETSIGGSPSTDGSDGQSSSEQEAIRQIDRRIVDSYQYGSPTARGPLKEAGVIDRLLDYKLGGEWSRAIEMLATSVSAPAQYRRWNTYHFKILIDILTGEGRIEELWKMWRLGKATNKFADITADSANSMLFRLGRQPIMAAVLNPEPGAAQGDQYIVWWVQMCKDLQTMITVDAKGEVSPKTANIVRAFEAEDPRASLQSNFDIISRITSRKHQQQQEQLQREDDAHNNSEGGAVVEEGGIRPPAPRRPYEGGGSGEYRGGGRGRGRGRGRGSWTLSDPTGENNQPQYHNSHNQRYHNHRGGGGEGGEEVPVVEGPPPRDYSIHDPVNVHELNDAIDQAQSVEDVERLLSVASQQSIDHDCNTFARRMQKICLRRRGYQRELGVDDPPHIANIWSDAIGLFHQGVAVSPNNNPSTLLCNNLMSELKKARRFQELQQVEVLMRGKGGEAAAEGSFWDVPPSSKTVDYLMSAYYREGYYTRCRELFTEMKINYAAKLSPLVYTIIIKIKSFEMAPRRNSKGEFVYPSQVETSDKTSSGDQAPTSPEDPTRKYPANEYTARAAARHAHSELSELVHEMVKDGVDNRLGEKANIALINAWTSARKRRR